jgi:hypothetical protein
MKISKINLNTNNYHYVLIAKIQLKMPLMITDDVSDVLIKTITQ